MKTECEELGWTKEHEKDGYYNEGGRLVCRMAGISIPSGILPHDANILRVTFMPDNCTSLKRDVMPSETGEWVILFTHPICHEVPEGDSAPIVATFPEKYIPIGQ